MAAKPLGWSSVELAALTAHVENLQKSFEAGGMNPCGANPCGSGNDN
jgi:hypothetical protein